MPSLAARNEECNKKEQGMRREGEGPLREEQGNCSGSFDSLNL